MNKVLIIALLCLSANQSKKTITDYFKTFPHRPDFISLNEDDHNHPTIDVKNAYLSISYDDPDYSYEYGGELAFTYFTRKDGSLLFGYSHFGEGPSSSFASAGFYTLAGSKWIEETKRVLPEISLNDFGLGSALVDSIGSEYRVRYELPQQGTNLTVTALVVGENDNPFSSSPEGYTEYTRIIESLRPLTLVWSKNEGVFHFKPK